MEDAIRLQPDYVEAYVNLGVAHHQGGNYAAAEVWYRRAIALNPKIAIVHNNLGAALCNLSRREEAEACFREALRLEPELADALNSLGVLLSESRQFSDAEALLRKAIGINPSFVMAHRNLGSVLNALGRSEAAEAACLSALALDPKCPLAHETLALVQWASGRHEAANQSLETAECLAPNLPTIRWNKGLLQLLLGDYEHGLPLFESRFDAIRLSPLGEELLRSLANVPQWDGSEIPDKTLLVWTEQGFGDCVMMMRYLPLIKQAHHPATIVVCCEPALARLFRLCGAVDRVISGVEGLRMDAPDLHCSLLSLPFLFGTRVQTIPSKVPYVAVPQPLKEAWSRRLRAIKDIKVGVAWRGRATHSSDHLRNVRLDLFRPLNRLQGVQLLSLQKGADEAELRNSGIQIEDWMSECGDFLDTAALISNLDLIVSVDTVIAHLAGALGKPVWLLNRFESEWRWMLEREDSPWYPTMRIFRQSQPRNWDDVIGRLVAVLESYAHGTDAKPR